MKKILLMSVLIFGFVISNNAFANIQISSAKTTMENTSIDIENAYNDTKKSVGQATSSMHTKMEETGIDIGNAYDDTKNGIKKWNSDMKLKHEQKKKADAEKKAQKKIEKEKKKAQDDVKKAKLKQDVKNVNTDIKNLFK